MFPRSSIKRLRFAFVAMAGLTLMALVVGCITFAHSYMTQKRFLAEATPLLVNVEQLSNAVVRFSTTSRQLETVDTQNRLQRLLTRHRSENDALQKSILDLTKLDAGIHVAGGLTNIVYELSASEAPYDEALRAKIDAKTSLIALQREIGEEGQALLDQLNPLALQSSLEMVNFVQGMADGRSDPDVLIEAMNKVELLTQIGFTAERFLQVVSRSTTDTSTPAALALRETLAPEFRHLTQLTLKLRDQGAQQAVAGSLRLFNEKALEAEGIAVQWQRFEDAKVTLDSLNQRKTVLLTRMSTLVDRLVVDAREAFFESANATERSSLMAVSTLAVLSLTAFVAVVWIGWRLINRDIARRLDHLANATVALADGDLDVAIDQSGSDELAEMARATETFRKNALELRRTEVELADRLIEVEGTNTKLLAVNTALDTVNADLAESELRYDLAVKGSSVGIWDFNVATKMLFWSDRYKEIVGITDDRTWREFTAFQNLLHPDDRERVVERFQNHLKSGESYNVEYRLRQVNGDYLWIHARGQAVWNEAGEPTRMAGSIDDISDRKSSEIKLNQYARELERSNQELDDFAYIASHDLKEPLRAMYNHATFLIEDFQEKLGEEGEKRLHRMIKLGKRMEKLISDLLYFSRLGRGDQTMEGIDLNGVIADIEANLTETLTSRKARIVVPEHLPSISGHPAHITALFQNLISNGVKYNDAEEKIIEIGLVPATEKESRERFETFYVWDNGIGIDDQFKDEIFRIFKRLNSEKAYGEGTGAGLTFVKKIVENHGGNIWIKPQAGEGTTFIFTLMREDASSATEADDRAA